jgi:hypothetical protein
MILERRDLDIKMVMVQLELEVDKYLDGIMIDKWL